MVGSLLGDATLLATTAGYCFRAHHGVAQWPLLQWKYEILHTYVRTAPRVSGPGCYFRTITHPQITALRSVFYSGSTKVLPVLYLERYLTDFGLAVWIMDDGSADGNQVRLNTQSFTLEEVAALGGLLERKFGLRVTVNMDKGKPRLRFASETMQRLRDLVRPHIRPELRYKLPA